jgi:hypothetical protein
VGDVLLFSLQLALQIAVPWWVVRRDLRRLSEERLARAWNDASFWISIVMFGPLCLPFHFAKTRRSLWGGVIGIAWMIGAFVVIGLVATGLGTLFDLK